MWSSGKRKLILSNLSLLELNHKKSDFHGTGSWFWLFRAHPQRMNACRDTANCYEYASRSEQSAPTASEALGRTALHSGTHTPACTHAYKLTSMQANVLNLVLQPLNSGGLREKAGRWVV